MRQRGLTLVELAVVMMIVAIIAAGLGSLLAWSTALGSRETVATNNAVLAEQALAQASRWVRAACRAYVNGSPPQQELWLALPRGDGTCPQLPPANGSVSSPDANLIVQLRLQNGEPVIALSGGSSFPLAPRLKVSGLSASVQSGADRRTLVAFSLTVGGRTYGTAVMPRAAPPGTGG